MADQKGQSEPIDSKLLRELNSRATLVGYPRPQACGVRDFVLPFIRGQADSAFGAESPITAVRQGIVGWGRHSNPPPRIVNTADHFPGAGRAGTGDDRAALRRNVGE